MDALFELTALPNPYPALLHFPIAFSAVALLFDAAVFIRGRWAAAEAAVAFHADALHATVSAIASLAVLRV